MSKLLLSKASLHKETHKLSVYRQYLPSLDLKRQQLIIERNRIVAEMAETERNIAVCERFVIENLPMLSNRDLDLSGLVKIAKVTIGEENIVGIQLPVITDVVLLIRPYSNYTYPHWVDHLVKELAATLRLKVALTVQRQRMEIMEKAVKRLTQKVNLFDKVLIPKASQNIRKIRIFLSDTERAGVVRAKITKQNRQLREL
ncbi:V-type ATP synthase subunit D [Methylicorpusculum sp.]|uniref:V-type ATP synthase subunit D n=1 Tax=Methylicorpusculum sp. TaxID=2713644 RepID=UPI002721EDA8|nr:V-type ATP synthase subunit D [Methylicorpusculum sp.]MDO8846139.1 V-type ATP synthase subunit D [Methylicorpusculum sp.]